MFGLGSRLWFALIMILITTCLGVSQSLVARDQALVSVNGAWQISTWEVSCPGAVSFHEQDRMSGVVRNQPSRIARGGVSVSRGANWEQHSSVYTRASRNLTFPVGVWWKSRHAVKLLRFYKIGAFIYMVIFNFLIFLLKNCCNHWQLGKPHWRPPDPGPLVKHQRRLWV